MIQQSKKLKVSLVTTLLILGLATGQVQADHNDHNGNIIAPLAAFIVLGSLLNHGHGHNHSGHNHGYYGHNQHHSNRGHRKHYAHNGHNVYNGHSGHNQYKRKHRGHSQSHEGYKRKSRRHYQ